MSLYPKLSQPLNPELFKNPTTEYRGLPFWSWNCELDPEELVRQIEVLKKMGFGGFHIHVRTGMATKYLSDEFMNIVRTCVEKARTEGLQVWLYDEDRYPSGTAGGYVTQNPQYSLRHLLLTRKPYTKGAKLDNPVHSIFGANRLENGELLAIFDVELNNEGDLVSYRRVGEEESVRGFKLYAYIETAVPNPWFNNQAYVNTLDPEAVAEFIRITHDRYYEKFADDFGGIIPAMFTDEPEFSPKQFLRFDQEERDITLPWTEDLPDTFARAYSGESLLDSLPELLWDLDGGRISAVRYHYHDHTAERFTQAFADQCGKWCSEHGIILTGHMVNEPTLFSQNKGTGEAMRSYRSFQLPGIDMLWHHFEFTTAKQAQSAARQYGRPGVMSELYGVTNWDFDFRGHKIQGDWQAALGVTVRVHHLSWVSMAGEAKRDCPATFNYQVPWHEQYPYIEDHFARINTALTRGRPVVRVGVVHPIESYWLHFGVWENTFAIREQMEENFRNVTEWLLTGLVDFDFICESLLPDQTLLTDITGQSFPVGEMAYDVVVVPGCETLRSTTLERLERFRDNGGRVIFLGGAPKYADADVSGRGKDLYERSERFSFERAALLNALSDLQELEIRNSSGSMTRNLIYQLRDEEENRWLFIAHARDTEMKDIPAGDILRIKLRGEYAVTLYDTVTGEITPLVHTVKNGWTTLEHPLYDHDSLLLRLDKKAGAKAEAKQFELIAPSAKNVQRFLNAVPVTLEEPNVLLLDMAEYALDGEELRPAEEILRLDNILRTELGWLQRGMWIAQPWVESDETTPHTLTLRYTIHSELDINGAKLGLENAAISKVKLNGVEAGAVNGWYVDKSIHTVDLPDIKAGSNVLEIVVPYGRKIDIEACYLLGDFGVKTAGCHSTLTKPVRELRFGDITGQGLPFYGGNITYHLSARTEDGTMTIAVPSYRSHLLTVSVNGKEAGNIVFSPYRLTVEGLTPGVHEIELKYYGSRVNTFGQLHRNIRSDMRWEPWSFRTVNDEWTYEYLFWKQGVLKSPEIY